MQKKRTINDKKLASVIIFLGRNFPSWPGIIKKEFFDKLEEYHVIEVGTLHKFTKTTNALIAAWPTKEDMEFDGLDKHLIKEFMREYFPWRISKSGEINYIDNDDDLLENI